jgi:predicted RNase H-like HicB family nuclease
MPLARLIKSVLRNTLTPVRKKITKSKNVLQYTAVIYPDADSDWLVAHNPETGTTTQGKTFEEALANLKEATELYLSEFPLAAKGRAVLTTFEVPSPAHA